MQIERRQEFRRASDAGRTSWWIPAQVMPALYALRPISGNGEFNNLRDGSAWLVIRSEKILL
jgi:uncharacterized membrane protein YhaH (DUF805 family)